MTKQGKPVQLPAVVPATTHAAILGKTLAARRVALGIGQADLAEKLRVNQGTWSRIERGLSALTVEQLRVVATVLGKTPGALLEDVERVTAQATRRGVHVLTSHDETTVDADVVMISGEALGGIVQAARLK